MTNSQEPSIREFMDQMKRHCQDNPQALEGARRLMDRLTEIADEREESARKLSACCQTVGKLEEVNRRLSARVVRLSERIAALEN